MCEDKPNALPSRQMRQLSRWQSKKMDDVAALRGIPPPQKLDFNARLLEGTFGRLDLNLKSPMREQKGTGMIEENFHVFAAGWVKDTTRENRTSEKSLVWSSLVVKSQG